MANYYGVGRTNYFKVKDVEAFNKWATELKLEVITNGELVGFIATNDDGTLPSYRNIENSLSEDEFGETDFVVIDFFNELANHLTDDTVAVFMAVGHEKHRYMHGEIYSVDSTGHTVQQSLHTIFESLESEYPNKKITLVEY